VYKFGSMAFGVGNLNNVPIATGNLRLAVGKFPKEVCYLSSYQIENKKPNC
jgi:hypothetical protein